VAGVREVGAVRRCRSRCFANLLFFARERAVFRRLLEIAEREDPAYTVLHQTATFTAKRKDIRWRAAQSFLMDFRAHNLAFPA
jgi:peptide/nickel transport system substrate-binding protein